jgi:hypothetical protein
VTPSLPSEHRDVVAAHKHDTVLYVLAEDAACRTRRGDLLGRIPVPRNTPAGTYGRHARAIDPADLRRFPSEPSWCMAVLACANDALERLVAWARGAGSAHLWRIRFYVDPPADPIKVLEPWTLAVSPLVDAFEAPSLNALTQAVLVQLNDQVYADHALRKPPGVP